MNLEDFDFELPPERIAKYPMTPRDHSRLLVASRSEHPVEHRHFYELGNFLRPGDLLVLNETKVIPARVHAQDEKGRTVELFLLSQTDPNQPVWQGLIRPAAKLGASATLHFKDGTRAEAIRTGHSFDVRFPEATQARFFEWLETVGEPPLPHYLKRPAESQDRETYQTVFAQNPGSVAAPTAGLHFTQELLSDLQAKGVEIAKLTLQVGYGTFAPIRSERIEDHVMHEETYTVPDKAWAQLQAAKQRGSRVIPVGTTALRALESLPFHGRVGSTRLFITPGFSFQWADALITNFHVPKSTLLILVSAFLGKEKTLSAYRAAVEKGYRFFSYGDAMAIF